MNEFLEQFLVEARELAEQAVDDLMALAQAPDDRERLDSVFRGFHTLKGAAGIVEFAAMGRTMHAAEDLLAKARAEGRVGARLVDDCLACLDQLGRWLDALAATGEAPGDAEQAATRLVTRLGGDEEVAAGESDGSWVERLRAVHPGVAGLALRWVPDADCFLRGEDPLARVAELPGLRALEIAPLRPWPRLEELDPYACNLVLLALAETTPAQAAAHLPGALRIAAAEGETADDTAGMPAMAAAVLREQLALAAGPAPEDSRGRLGAAGRVAVNVLRHLGRATAAAKVEAALAGSLAAMDPAPFLAALEAILQEAGPAVAVPQAITAGTTATAGVLRVDVARIDAVVRLTGELTVVKNALGHLARLAREGGDAATIAASLKQQHGLLERLTGELQQSALAMRVLPLRQVFRRFPALVRDMAGRLGKAARLETEGEGTEADKAVVEALFEPLLHLLRNALDHGVESAAARAASGKPETAVIRLSGRREGEQVIIEVADDGAGIDVAAIRRLAAERGLMARDALAALSEDELAGLIFMPGFSTAAAVTDLSGRGVGMDAVRSAIERLGGRVTIASRRGKGTSVRLTLPFTLMMTRVMTVEAGGQVFGVPFEAVVETLQLPRSQIIPIGSAAAFVLRGRTVPLLGLAHALDLAPAGEVAPVARLVVTEQGGVLGALEVDRFGERLDVMLKPMEGLLTGVRGVAGTTLLGDGRVLIVLDLQELLQ